STAELLLLLPVEYKTGDRSRPAIAPAPWRGQAAVPHGHKIHKNLWSRRCRRPLPPSSCSPRKPTTPSTRTSVLAAGPRCEITTKPALPAECGSSSRKPLMQRASRVQRVLPLLSGECRRFRTDEPD